MEVVSRQIFPDDPSNIVSFLVVEVNHTPQRVCVKADARSNMPYMVVTLDTYHSDRSLYVEICCEREHKTHVGHPGHDKSVSNADAK